MMCENTVCFFLCAGWYSDISCGFGLCCSRGATAMVFTSKRLGVVHKAAVLLFVGFLPRTQLGYCISPITCFLSFMA